jgi:hypothetical protein
MHPADFLNKWLAVIPAAQQAAFYAELTALVTPPDKHISVESFVSDLDGRRMVLVRLGPYVWDVSPEEAIRIGYMLQRAAVMT